MYGARRGLPGWTVAVVVACLLCQPAVPAAAMGDLRSVVDADAGLPGPHSAAEDVLRGALAAPPPTAEPGSCANPAAAEAGPRDAGAAPVEAEVLASEGGPTSSSSPSSSSSTGPRAQLLRLTRWLGPWAPLTAFALFLLGLAAARLAWQTAHRVVREVLVTVEGWWQAFAPPFLADIHPLRYSTVCSLLVTFVACCFPVVIHYYAQPIEPLASECPAGWSFFSNRCFIYLPTGFPSLLEAQQACEGRGGQLARAWTQRDNTFLKDLVLSVGQMSTKFDFQDDFLGPKETYGTQVWHSFDPTMQDVARCVNPTFPDGCPALCEKTPQPLNATVALSQLVETLFCSWYYATVLVLVFHSPVEQLLCNRFILWVQNGMDHEVLKQLRPDWLAHPSCGVVLLAMLRNRRFTRRPALYLGYRLLCLAAVLCATALTGRGLRHQAAVVLPDFLQDRWQHRVSPRSQLVQRVIIGILSDACLLPFFYLLFLRQETLRNQMEIIGRPPVSRAAAPDPAPVAAAAGPGQAGEAGEAEAGEAGCRICHDGGPDLIQPCECRGSMAYAHSACLNKWREYTHSPAECDVCRCPYTFRPVYVRPVQVVQLLASALGVVLGRVLAFVAGVVSLVGLYTQGAILYILTTKRVRIHYLCTNASPNDFHFELTHQFPARQGPLAEPETTSPDHLIFLFGVTFYMPLLILWGTRTWFQMRRQGAMVEDPTETLPRLLRAVFVMVTAHCAFNHVALAWPTVARLLGRPIPALPEPLGLKEFLAANYLAALVLTVAQAVLAEAWRAVEAAQQRRLSQYVLR